MKKSLIALAVLGTFAGAALADSVTVYGLLDEGIQHFSNGTNSNTQISSGEAYQSRLGFKGSEDLGNGLKAGFMLEEGLNTNNTFGGSSAKATNTYNSSTGVYTTTVTNTDNQPRVADVSLSGSFGTIVAGRMGTFNHSDITDADPFILGMTGNADRIAGSGTMSAFDPVTRTTAIGYVAPSFNGLTVGAAWTTQSNATGYSSTGAQATGAWTVHAGYAAGPAAANFDYIEVKDGTSSKAVKDYLLTGAYNFGVAKITAAYGNNKPDATNAVNNGHEYSGYLLGAIVPVGAGDILASYVEGKDKTAGIKATQYAIGYKYNLSKRTSVYTSYAHVSNDNNYGAQPGGTIGQNMLAAPTGTNSASGFDAGMVVKF